MEFPLTPVTCGVVLVAFTGAIFRLPDETHVEPNAVHAAPVVVQSTLTISAPVLWIGA